MKAKRIVLGYGYPWYGNDNTQPPEVRTIKLCSEKHGKGIVKSLKIRDSGAWRKYRLVLEKI